MLGHVVGVVERLRDKVFIGGSGLGIGVGRQVLYILRDTGTEGFIAGAQRVSQQGAVQLSSSWISTFAVCNQNAEHLISVMAEHRLHLEFKAGHAGWNRHVERERAFGGKVIGAQFAAIRAGAEREFTGGFRAQKLLQRYSGLGGCQRTRGGGIANGGGHTAPRAVFAVRDHRVSPDHDRLSGGVCGKCIHVEKDGGGPGGSRRAASGRSRACSATAAPATPVESERMSGLALE